MVVVHKGKMEVYERVCKEKGQEKLKIINFKVSEVLTEGQDTFSSYSTMDGWY